MKNLRLGLYITALVSLICVFTPCDALAQQDGPIPRPIPGLYNALSSVTPFTDSGIQSWIASAEGVRNNIESIHAQLPGNPATTPVSDRLSPVALTATSKAINMPAIEESRKSMSYKRQS